MSRKILLSVLCVALIMLTGCSILDWWSSDSSSPTAPTAPSRQSLTLALTVHTKRGVNQETGDGAGAKAAYLSNALLDAWTRSLREDLSMLLSTRGHTVATIDLSPPRQLAPLSLDGELVVLLRLYAEHGQAGEKQTVVLHGTAVLIGKGAANTTVWETTVQAASDASPWEDRYTLALDPGMRRDPHDPVVSQVADALYPRLMQQISGALSGEKLAQLAAGWQKPSPDQAAPTNKQPPTSDSQPSVEKGVKP
jgi:hypothetical protein